MIYLRAKSTCVVLVGRTGYFQPSARLPQRFSHLSPLSFRCPVPAGPTTSSEPFVMQTISQLLIAFQKLVRLLQLTLSQSLQVFFLLTPSFFHIAPQKKQNYGKRWSCLCTKLPLPPVISEAYVQGATGVLPPPPNGCMIVHSEQY